MSDSLRPQGLQQARPPCPSPTPGVYSNSCPLSRWYDPTISSSVIPFSSHLQSFSAAGSFQMGQIWKGSDFNSKSNRVSDPSPRDTPSWLLWQDLLNSGNQRTSQCSWPLFYPVHWFIASVSLKAPIHRDLAIKTLALVLKIILWPPQDVHIFISKWQRH